MVPHLAFALDFTLASLQDPQLCRFLGQNTVKSRRLVSGLLILMDASL